MFLSGRILYSHSVSRYRSASLHPGVQLVSQETEDNKHLMTGPRENSECCFPETRRRNTPSLLTPKFNLEYNINGSKRKVIKICIGSGARFSKLPVVTGPFKLFCFPFQMGVSKVLNIIQ